MNYREEILKYLSLEELEKEIQTKKTELKGLVSTESIEFIIAKELGIQAEGSGTEKEKEKIAIEAIEKINEDLCKEIEKFSTHSFNHDELTDIQCLMNAVSEILQFLENEFPNALDIIGRPIQRTIFQNARYRLYIRMNRIREQGKNK